ncbi:MAG: hypothetical protein II823_03725 [Kiritimatiellae bacterium]|nr:hypothetical protein [Kiritimatiellia bacterium]
MKMKCVALFMALVVAGASFAAGLVLEDDFKPPVYKMPTKAEIAAARPIVSKQMAPFVVKLKSKEMTATEVGNKASQMSAAAASSAEKYLYLRGVVAYAVRDKKYDWAAGAISGIMMQFPDVPDEEVLELTAKASKGVSAKDAPELFTLQRFVKAKKAYKARPTDKKVIRSLAELTALEIAMPPDAIGQIGGPAHGAWKDACALFAKLDGDIGRIAKEELAGGFSLLSHADFWWDYAPQENNAVWWKRSVGDKLRQRTVKYYLADLEKLSGADRERAERRIMEYDPENGRMTIAAFSGNIAVVKSLQNEEAMQHNASEKNPLEWLLADSMEFSKNDTLKDVVERFEREVFKGQVKINVANQELLKHPLFRVHLSGTAKDALARACKQAGCEAEIDADKRKVTIRDGSPFERRIDFSFKSSNTLQDVVAFFEKDVFNGQVKITVADAELLKKAAPLVAASDIEAREALELMCESAGCKIEIDTRAKTVAISKM